MPTTNKYIICDIDGTVANLEHRRHLVTNGNHDWDKFFYECAKDTPIVEIIEILRAVVRGKSYEPRVIFVSGRSDVVRGMTELWLEKHAGQLLFDPNTTGDLRMRKAGDTRPDDIVKAELTKDLEPEDVWFVLDDRDRVVKMWRERGFRCLQVAEGDF